MAKQDFEHEIYLQSLVNIVHDAATEKSVLASIIEIKDFYYQVADKLFEDLFYKREYQLIFRAVKMVAEAGKPIDKLSVLNILRELKLKEYPDLFSVINHLSVSYYTHAHIDGHIDILTSIYQRRQLIKLSSETQRKCTELEQPEEIMNFINQELVGLTQINDTDFNVETTVFDVMKSIYDTTIKNLIKSGIASLDEFIGGFEYKNLVVVGGAASMGKTAFALCLFQNFIDQNLCPVYFSLEMSTPELVSRMLASDAEVHLSSIRHKNLLPSQRNAMDAATIKLSKKRFVIDEKVRNLNQLMNKIRKYTIKNNSKVVILDYLQLVKVDLGKRNGGTREQEIATISRSLKEMAMDFGILVIALSQLSREVGKRQGSKRPMLSDLRESGSIEQDADFVIFPYRPAYYEVENNKIPFMETAELVIAKGRGTGMGNVEVKFISKFTKYYNEKEPQVKTGDTPSSNELDF